MTATAAIDTPDRAMRPEDWPEVHHFKPEEFKSPEKMSYEFMLWLDKLREEVGMPMVITSSYRDPEYNRLVGGAKDSAHTDVPCRAVDIGERTRPDDPNWNRTRFAVVSTAIKMGCTRIGSYQNGSLHLDMSHGRPEQRMWRVVGAVKS